MFKLLTLSGGRPEAHDHGYEIDYVWGPSSAGCKEEIYFKKNDAMGPRRKVRNEVAIYIYI